MTKNEALRAQYGQVAYEAYCQSCGNKSKFTGHLLPAWADVDDDIQEHWIKASYAAIECFSRDLRVTLTHPLKSEPAAQAAIEDGP